MKETEAELEEKTGRIAKFTEALKKFGQMKEDYLSLQRSHQELLQKAATTAIAHQPAVDAERRLEELKREHELHKTLIDSRWKAQVARMQKEIDDLKQHNRMEEEGPSKRQRQELVEVPTVEADALEEVNPQQQEVQVGQRQEEEEQESEGHWTAAEDGEEAAHEQENEHEIAHEHDAEVEGEVGDQEQLEEYMDEEVGDHDEDMEAEVEGEEEAAIEQQEEDREEQESREMEIEEAQQPHAQIEATEETVQSAATQPTAAETAKPLEDFDIDSFLDVEPSEKKIINLSPSKPTTLLPTSTTSTNAASSTTIPTGTLNRTITLPTSSASSTFTAAPVVAPARRIIDLSQTGKKPLPLSTTTTATATTTSSSTQTATATSVRGRHHLVRGKPGRKIKRGGPSAGSQQGK